MMNEVEKHENWEPPFKWAEGEERPFIVTVGQLNARAIEKVLIREGINPQTAYDVSTAFAGVGLI